MRRIAIPIITLMAGGILAAQITPQAAQTIQSQARTAGKSAQSSPVAPSPVKSSASASKPDAAAKSSSPMASKASAQSPASTKPSAMTPATGKPAPTNVQNAKAPAPAPGTAHNAKAAVVAAPTKAKPAVATVSTASPKSASHIAAPKPAVRKAVKKEEQPKVKEAMVKTESPAPEPKPVINLTSRRDPFTSPVTRALAVNQGPGCSTGKRCLAVDQMILRGIVRSPNGMIAVVENGAKRAYFLRENDPVWHGMVVKINGDSVVFREESVDSKTGKSSTHEVVKRVNAPVV